MADFPLAPCPWCGLMVRMPHASEDECIQELRAVLAERRAKPLKTKSHSDRTERPPKPPLKN